MNESKLDFVFYGGRPCLDLYNTVRRRKDVQTDTQDLLDNAEAFKRWVLKAQTKSDWSNLIPPLSENVKDIELTDHKAAEQIKHQAILLRDIVARFLHKNYTQKDIEVVNQLSKLRPIWNLSTDDNELSVLANLDLEGVLGLIAEDIIQLISSEQSNRIKECAHERCGIVFLDKSRGNNRNWCSMKTCGNRAKVARFSDKNS